MASRPTRVNLLLEGTHLYDQGRWSEARNFYGEQYVLQVCRRTPGSPRSLTERIALMFLACSTLREEPQSESKKRFLEFAVTTVQNCLSLEDLEKQYLIASGADTFFDIRDYRRSLSSYKKADLLLERLPPHRHTFHLRALCKSKIADCYVLLNRLPQAVQYAAYAMNMPHLPPRTLEELII